MSHVPWKPVKKYKGFYSVSDKGQMRKGVEGPNGDESYICTLQTDGTLMLHDDVNCVGDFFELDRKSGHIKTVKD